MNKIILYLFCLLFVSGCEQKEILNLIKPEVFVSSAYLNANGKTIEVNCETINPSSVNKEEFGICWSEKPNPLKTDNYQYSGNNSIEEGPFVEQIKNVKPNTIYYIKGYMRVAGNDIYSEEFIYRPDFPFGWNRLEDIPREKGVINLPVAYLDNTKQLIFRRKTASFETSIEYKFNENGKFWSSNKVVLPMYYNQFITDIEYAPEKFDFLIGGGYYIENAINGKKKYIKTSGTSNYPVIENYPGNDLPAVGFGAGNKAFVIELKSNPNMYAFNEDNFIWEKLKNPPFTNFTNIKATRANSNGFIILENSIASGTKLRVFQYDFKTDTWQQLEDFPGKDRTDGVLFSIKNKVYFGLGEQKTDEAGLKDFWEYDLTTKKWIQIANYPGTGSSNIAYVKKGNSVFLGMGYSSIVTKIGTSRKFLAYDFWEFKP